MNSTSKTYTSNPIADAELTEMIKDDIYSRTLANIARRAETLFTDGGYTVKALGERNYIVFSPKGDIYSVFTSDLPAGEIFGSYCTCPAFTKFNTCKHYQAVELMRQDEADAALCDAMADAADYDRFAYRY